MPLAPEAEERGVSGTIIRRYETLVKHVTAYYDVLEIKIYRPQGVGSIYKLQDSPLLSFEFSNPQIILLKCFSSLF